MQIVRKVAHSGLLGPAVLFAVGTVALASTPNQGTAFALPLLSAFTLVPAWGLTRAPKYLQRGGVIVIAAAVLIVYIPDVDLRWSSAQLRFLTGSDVSPWAVRIPGIGDAVITDGRGTLQRYEAEGIQLGGSGQALDRAVWKPEPIDAATTREWQTVNAETIEFIRRENQSSMPVSLGFRHYLYNTGLLQLAQLSKYDYEIPFVVIDPTSLGESEDAYFEWLTNGSASRSCLLFTSAGILNESPPVTDSDALTSAAHRAHFLSFAQWTLPDGRDVVAWRRDSDVCRKD